MGAAEAAARRDPLTGLANRLRWQEELDQIGEQVAVGAPAAVLVLDLNGLKAVNDEHGHDAGDDYLVAAASTLRGAARDQDVVARLGGDEFGVLVPGAGPEPAARLVERIRDALAVGARCPAVRRDRRGELPPLRSVRAAFAEADRVMYADKTARRRA